MRVEKWAESMAGGRNVGLGGVVGKKSSDGVEIAV